MQQLNDRAPTWITAPWVLPAAIALAAVAFPLMGTSDRWIRVAALALIYVGLASGLNILVGMTGLLDLGYVAFFIVGAYTAGILSIRLFVEKWSFAPESLWWLFPVSIVLAVLFAGIAGSILGYPTLRARGDYLAIMTLAFGEIIRLVTINWTGFTGGAVGIRGIPPVGAGDYALTSATGIYFVVLGAVVLILLGVTRLVASPIGRAWIAIREDELVAASVGVKTRRYKLLAYVCGGAVAGVVGVVFAHMQQFINPDSFTLEDNFIILSLVILGGAGTLWGPVLGAVVWMFFLNWARDFDFVREHPEFRLGVLALLVIIIMIKRPQGIVSIRPRLAGNVPVDIPSVGKHFTIDARNRDASDAVSLSAEGVSRYFGGLKALDEMNFQVRRGEIVGLMGPNGAGKSTLVNVLSGVTPPSSGEIRVGGVRVDALGPEAASINGIARTFQNIRLFGEMTVWENLLVGAHDRVRANVLRVLFRAPAVRRAEAAAANDAVGVLRLTGLWDDRNKRANTLSYGHQRRVEIARALMTQPRVLLLDEPAAGMNETETRELARLIRQIRDHGIDIVLIEHDMDLLMTISDRLVVLDHGAVIGAGTPDEVRQNARVLEAYLGVEA